jgi:hypothetical protein
MSGEQGGFFVAVVLIVIAFFAGCLVGGGAREAVIRMEAVEYGAGQFVITNQWTGEVGFQWKTSK